MKKTLLATTVASVLICGLSMSSVYAEPPRQEPEQPGFQKDNGPKGQPNNQKEQKQFKDDKGPTARPDSYKPEPSHNKPQSANQSHPGAPKSGKQTQASYEVNSRNREVMHQHYQRILKNVNRYNRPQFIQGQPIPSKYRPYITPSPYSLKKRVPHVPDGYVMGYYQGYTVIYDPKTFVILTLVDLLVNY